MTYDPNTDPGKITTQPESDIAVRFGHISAAVEYLEIATEQSA